MALQQVGVAKDFEHGRHHQVRNREAVGNEVVTRAKRSVQLIESIFDGLHGCRARLRLDLIVLLEEVDAGKVCKIRLNRVQRREQPAYCLGSFCVICWQEFARPRRNVENDGATLEQGGRPSSSMIGTWPKGWKRRYDGSRWSMLSRWRTR